jgi:hypothetical protein
VDIFDAQRRFPLALAGIGQEVSRDVHGRHHRAAAGQQARVMPLAAADVQAAKSADFRQNLQELRRVETVARPVIAGAAQDRPRFGVGVPISAYFGVVHVRVRS